MGIIFSAPTGTVSTSSTSYTTVTISPPQRMLSVTVDDGDQGGLFYYAINDAVSTASGTAPMSGIMVPLASFAGIGTLTLYATNSAGTYTVSPLFHTGV